MEEFYSSWQGFIFKKQPTVERSVCREILMMNASVPFWHEDLPLHLFTTRHVVYLWMWDAKIPLYVHPGGMWEDLGALNWQNALWYSFSSVSLFHMGGAADEATHITVVSTLNILHHKCLWTQNDSMCSKNLFPSFFPEILNYGGEMEHPGLITLPRQQTVSAPLSKSDAETHWSQRAVASLKTK